MEYQGSRSKSLNVTVDYKVCTAILHFHSLCPPNPEGGGGGGGIIVFLVLIRLALVSASAFIYMHYLLNQLMGFDQACIDT